MKKTLVIIITCLSCCTAYATGSQKDVLETVRRTNDYFMKKYADPTTPTFVKKQRSSNLWTRAVYYEGLMALYSIDPQERYLEYTDRWADFHKWTARGGNDATNADNQCCEQTYLDRHRMTGRGECIRNVKTNLDHQMSLRQYDAWWWIDAIQMAMPVYAKYYAITGERRYLDYAMGMYRHTRDTIAGGLLNKEEGLWWRDKNYKAPYKEPDGKNCYWSRGNGWVYAALARVMDEMGHRAEGRLKKDEAYRLLANDFRLMSRSLKATQRSDGYWNASLVSTNYEGPEVTGTALFLYGMAWGIRHGLIKAKDYHGVCDKAWQAVRAAIHDDGFIGYNQGTGADPSTGQPVTYTSIPDFEDYGTGCVLLAAAEYYKLLGEEKR